MNTDLLVFVAIGVAIIIAIRILTAVRGSSPEEEYYKTFQTVYGASQPETERAFQRSFVKAKNPLIRIYGELRFLQGRDDLSEEESKQKRILEKEEREVLVKLKKIYNQAFAMRPREARAMALELNVLELLELLETPEVVVGNE